MDTTEEFDWYLLDCGHYGYQLAGHKPRDAWDGQGGLEVPCHICPSRADGPWRRVVKQVEAVEPPAAVR